MIDVLAHRASRRSPGRRRPRRASLGGPTWRVATLAVLMLLSAGIGLGDRGYPPVGSVWAQDNPPSEGQAAEPMAAAEPDASWDRRNTFLASLTIFVLAVFLGFELITKVPPTLHTPLMSGSNAISGITLVGAILVTGTATTSWVVRLWGTLAIILATINAVGGFAVTHRMLAMFRRK
jgi:NAD(P) transhydrogenase subunit alpha